MDGWQAFQAVVRARPGHPAVVQGAEEVSFAALHDLALGYAAVMAGRGVTPGARVVVQRANGVDAVALPLAVWALGAVPVLAPAEVGVAGASAALDDIAARVGAALVISDKVAECTAAPFCIAEDLVAEARRREPWREIRTAGGGQIGSILFTSGSTGRPKGVMQTHATLLDGVDRVAQAVGFGAADRLLCAVPFAHDYGWGQLLALYRLGLTLVLPMGAGLPGLPEAISRHRPTVFGGVPSVYAGLTRGVSDLAGRDRSSLRLVMSTGSAMPLRIWQDLAQVFPHARRCLNYGLTETFRSATLREADEALAPGVVGSALPGAGLCVVDAAGQALPAGQWGEVVHRGAGVFAGYWQDPEQTALRRRPDPMGSGIAVFTGDRGMLDDAGRLTLGDRIDRMVKVMGLQASPARIEGFLTQVPGVEAAAVVARRHEVMGAELVAVLVGNADTLKAAQAACRALAPHERPRSWVLSPQLPLTASGKVDLVRLAAEAGASKDGQIAHPTG